MGKLTICKFLFPKPFPGGIPVKALPPVLTPPAARCYNRKQKTTSQREKEVQIMSKGFAIVVFIVGIVTVMCGAAATAMGAVGLGRGK